MHFLHQIRANLETRKRISRDLKSLMLEIPTKHSAIKTDPKNTPPLFLGKSQLILRGGFFFQDFPTTFPPLPIFSHQGTKGLSNSYWHQMSYQLLRSERSDISGFLPGFLRGNWYALSVQSGSCESFDSIFVKLFFHQG